MNIYMIQHNWQSKYLVVINENTHVSVYKYEKCKFDAPFVSFQAKNIFIGKSKICVMTENSGALNKSEFDGNTILLECEDNKYVYISGLEIFEFRTDDKIIDYISLMGNNMVPYTFGVGEKYSYFISDLYNFIENDKIEEGSLLNRTNDNLDPYYYHLEKCGADSFKTLEKSQIHTFYTHNEEGEENEDDDLVEEDEENEDLIETNYCNGTNEVVKIFNQKCVICYEKDSVYAFRQRGHQCICEQCYQNRGDIDILKFVVCRT